MDDADLAQQHIAVREQNVDRAIQAAKHKARLMEGASLRAMGTKLANHCIDCGDDIPVERMIKVPGARRCVWCQQEAEVSGRG